MVAGESSSNNNQEVIEIPIDMADIGQIMTMVFTNADPGRPGHRGSLPKRKGGITSVGGPITRSKKKKQRMPPIDNPYNEYYDQDECEYYDSLSHKKQCEIADLEKIIIDINELKIPLRFRILQSGVDSYVKSIAIRKLETIYNLDPSSSEYNKTMQWIDSLCKLPINKYIPLPVDPESSLLLKRDFIINTRNHLDRAVYGHENAKNHLIRMLAQWISKPDAKGMVIGLCGSPGTGKTQIAVHGISKALGLPFSFITLGGASDGSFLEGFSLTYEGSTHGRICEVLMKAKCSNPVLFFDELDKVSESHRGEEVSSMLVHMTDPAQNNVFVDKYFGSDIKIDLSRCLMIFSYNDEDKISPILRDRMYKIHVAGYNIGDKIKIARRHLLPDIMKEHAFENDDIVFDDETIQHIISNVTIEEGVRNLKRGLNSIVGEINLKRVMDPENTIFPLAPESSDITRVLKSLQNKDVYFNSMYM
jgi:ATP-dependent Lon protease